MTRDEEARWEAWAKRRGSPVCSEQGCDKTPTARGMCDKHYHAWYYGGGLGRRLSEAERLLAQAAMGHDIQHEARALLNHLA